MYISESRHTVVSHKAKKKQYARVSSGLCHYYSELANLKNISSKVTSLLICQTSVPPNFETYGMHVIFMIYILK